MAYGDFKGLSRRTVSDKTLSDKAFNIFIKNVIDNKWILLQWFLDFLMKKNF